MSSSHPSSLPKDSFSGTVAGVSITYNEETAEEVRGIGNVVLKKKMEEMAVQAALQRGFTSILIR